MVIEEDSCRLESFTGGQGAPIPSSLLATLPYVLTIIILAGCAARSRRLLDKGEQ